ncbi:cyclic nucleotide-binding domain protein (macronuclear) [Tetrahymena thermophila SB210]|uniref:Cyclic nucleotide-binding domain protein n=1 Tax=Tetrahymena thermophila (strain SB210) TaxID=312017 RepID=Q245W7_TETTS|nr:cyclic nucleotide-binding domain protein [Tetrahymena thermophila SB210]EAS03516.2 cyclic nucleotide-binding domain protein [Tetrahymena thermophila SB210]|eukprot:XP_001023761.2 cyclic nucleotide-binding domain protein [Tetrahymena thermophila SB210]
MDRQKNQKEVKRDQKNGKYNEKDMNNKRALTTKGSNKNIQTQMYEPPISDRMIRVNRSKLNFNKQDHEDLKKINLKTESIVEFEHLDFQKNPIFNLDSRNGNYQREILSPHEIDDLEQLQAYYISSANNINGTHQTGQQSMKEDAGLKSVMFKNSNYNSVDNKLLDENTINGDLMQKGTIRNSIFEASSNMNGNTLGLEKQIQLIEADKYQNRRERQNSGEMTNRNIDYSKKGEIKKTIKGSFKLIIQILPKMRKFLETKTYLGRTRFLNERIRDLIDDQSDFNKRKGYSKNYFAKMLECFLSIIEKICVLLRLDKIPLFDPENMIKLAINTIIVTYNCFFLFITSIEVCFSAHFPYANIFHSIALGAWITEMLLQMNTATYYNNTFTKDRKLILQIYFKEYIFFEILPLLFEGRSSDSIPINIMLHLPLLLKIKGIMIILKKIEFYALQMLEKHYILFLLKLCGNIIILGHIIACTRNIISSFEVHVLGEQNTWVAQFQSAEWHVIYIECLYWSFAIMMHNLSEKPSNDIEQIYSCLIMLLTSIIFGFMLNSIGNILADISKQQEEYKKDLNILNSYMKRRNIDLSLRRRVNSNLLKYYHQQSRDKIIQEKETISKLSPYIQNELIYSSNHKLLKQFPLFYQTFSQETISKLYNIMEEVIYAPNQMIFSQYQGHEDSIFLIQQGQVTLFVEREEIQTSGQPINFQSTSIYFNKKQQQPENSIHKLKKTLQILKNGDSFGLFNFITGIDKNISAQSNKFSQIIKINRNNFLTVIKENKADYEKFMEIKDKILYDKNYKVIKDLTCAGCHSQDHMVDFCNKTFFDKQNIYIFHHFNYSPNQIRNNNVLQRKLKKLNCFQNKRSIEDKAKNYAEDNSLIDSDHDISFDSQGNPIQNSQSSSSESQSDDQEDNDQKSQSSLKDQIQNVQDEKMIKSIIKKKYSLSALKSFDITSLQSENLEDPYNIKQQTTKQTEKEFASEYIGDEEISNFFRSRTKSHHNMTNNVKKSSLYKLSSEQDVISPKGQTESQKVDFTPQSKLDSIYEKTKSNVNTFKERSPQSPSVFYELAGATPALAPRKSILIINNEKEKDEASNNQFLKTSNINTMNTHGRHRHSIRFLDANFIKKFYSQQQQQTQENLQTDEYFEWKIDKVHEFQNYYVYYNYINVIRRFNNNLYVRNGKRKKTLRTTKTKLKAISGIKLLRPSGIQLESKQRSRQQSSMSINQLPQDDRIIKTSENDLN